MPLVVFSVVVLFFDEMGCLVRERRILLLKGEEDFRGSGREDQEERCLVGDFSGREEGGVAGWRDAWRKSALLLVFAQL